jgi:hypothetical protein
MIKQQFVEKESGKVKKASELLQIKGLLRCSFYFLASPSQSARSCCKVSRIFSRVG